MTVERRLRAMGSDAHLVVVGGRAGVIDEAVRRVADLERKWSRFLPDSEVSTLTRKAGTPVAVSDETRLLVTTAIEAWRTSGGAFDATVLGDVIRAGYDASFETLTARDRGGVSALGLGSADIVIDGDTACLPAGVGFDPGGIGKGLAADIVVGELLAAGADGACVNLGGDVRVAGAAPEGGGWTVAIEHPWSTCPVALVGLHDGAVATSTTLRRAWLVDGEMRHHVIDPATGAPAHTDLTAASVIADAGWLAEVLTKTILLRGAARAFDLLDGTGAHALAVDAGGHVLTTDGFELFTGGIRWPDRLTAPPAA